MSKSVMTDPFRVPAPEDIKNSRLFKAFHSIIQGHPVDHSIAYNPTGT